MKYLCHVFKLLYQTEPPCQLLIGPCLQGRLGLSYIFDATTVTTTGKAVNMRRRACSWKSFHVCLSSSKVIEFKFSVHVTLAKPLYGGKAVLLLPPIMCNNHWPSSLYEPERECVEPALCHAGKGPLIDSATGKCQYLSGRIGTRESRSTAMGLVAKEARDPYLRKHVGLLLHQLIK